VATRTEEISAAVTTTADGVGEAVAAAESLLEAARQMYEDATAHGWRGVASNLEQATEHLESVLRQLQNTEQSCQMTTETLDRIDDTLSSLEVTDHLVTSIGEMDEALSTAHRAISLTDEAIQYSEAAGATGLAGSIITLREEIEPLPERLGQLHIDLDAERRNAETYAETAGNGLMRKPSPRPANELAPPEDSTKGPAPPHPRPDVEAPASGRPDPPAWVQQAGRYLPERSQGSPTRGVVLDPTGSPLLRDAIVSSNDPSTVSDLTLVGPERRAASLLSHVESKVAAKMRRGELPGRHRPGPEQRALPRSDELRQVPPPDPAARVAPGRVRCRRPGNLSLQNLPRNREQDPLMSTSAVPLHLVWGALPRGRGQHEATVSSSQDLRALLERIHAEFLDRGLAQQIDAWPGDWKVTDPGFPNPFIQFLLGHPERGSLLWHEGDDSYQAADSNLPPLPGAIIYDNGGAADPMDPEATRITPDAVRDILATYIETGRRPQHVTWTTL
jgi:hypothetical protein